MDKILKRTLLGAAVALASTGAMAKQVGVNSDFNVDVYGVAAISVVNYNTTDNRDDSSGFAVENESRIGFRAHKEMYDDLTITMQIESGYVDNTDWGHGGVSGGVLGFRDTYLGASGEWGNLRVGRVLTPLYEIVDWPFSNPGLGAAFDWGGIAAHYDRQSNQVRYDSPKFGGFSFAASAGRDDGKNGGGSATRDSNFIGANARYSFSTVTLMGGVESASDFNGIEGDDTFAYIVGFEAGLPAGFGIAAAFKGEEVDSATKGKHTQDSFSIVGQYWNGPLGIKVGYAANLDSELKGVDQDDANNILSGQVMGVIKGFVPYVRVAARSDFSAEKDTDIVTRLGIEYGF
ncbi:porin [Vibrio natriegens]|uniref:porin n=1 Tax=Vibrio natriegens TaxID=691 RepID=UPI002283C6C6|nr:porin [Vibrio natriegens]MCY9875378.1 porin [Vibrio natriegens]